MLTLARAALVAIIGLFALPASAEGERTILVLDGSGSMWGQIDGENKIVIARRVIGDLLETLPEDLELGLTVYGHRRKGDCSDIETLVAPAVGTRGTIRDAVNAVNPKGKTPLSDAVVAAAEELKFSEEKATVILVSDGRETCQADPCEIGRKLEQTGVDFTAHVIGFDVAEEKDKAQLRCLAENTGGKFLSAANASELSAALEQVSVAPPPEPETITVSFRATEGENGPPISGNLVWTVTAVESGEVLVENETAPRLQLDLEQKLRYRAEALRTTDEASAEMEFTTGSAGPRLVTLVFDPPPLPEATVSGPATAGVATEIEVEWTGPDQRHDYVAIAKPDAAASGYQHYTYTRNGSPAALPVPAEPGEYELRYVLSKPRTVLATQPITIEEATATVDAPETAQIGSTIAVSWTGPDTRHDYIAIAKPDAAGNRHEHYRYTRTGSPVDLLMPAEPGTYEIRYVLGKNRRILATRSITIEEASATLDAIEAAPVGSTVKVEWTGPDERNDFISIAEPEAEGGKHAGYAYTRNGSPAKLLMPSQPGQYELRYILNQKKRILATRPITVEEADVSVTAPATATVGSTIPVEWTGPDAQNDLIVVAAPDAEGNKYENYTYTRTGSPAKLLMPARPGDYEIRYVLYQDKTVLARQPISIEEAEVSVSAPQTSGVGETVLVEWTGPDAQNDLIVVAVPDAEGNKYENYTYTRTGSPAKLLVPSQPGEYEIRYVLYQDKTVLARQPISVQPAEASVSGPATAEQATTVTVEWTGPDAQNDLITVATADAPGGKRETYSYTRNGSPLKLEMPATPGEYEIRYVLYQDKTILARQPVTVEPATVSLDAKDTVKPEANVAVDWVGPNGSGDYIAIALPNMEPTKYLTYRHTRAGSPVLLKAPVVPSTYELRYILKRSGEILARRKLVVE